MPPDISGGRPTPEPTTATENELLGIRAPKCKRPETPDECRARRRATDWYGEPALNADLVEYLEGLDRRREAARRLPPICGREHEHTLACHDPDLAESA